MGFFDKVFGPTVAAAINGLTDKVVAATREEISKYAPQLLDLLGKEFEKYFPQLLELAKEELAKYGPQLMDVAKTEIHDRLDEWMPILVTAMSKTVTETTARLAIEGEDKLTNMIPGDLDDKIIDPVFKSVMDWMPQIFAGNLPPKP